MKYALLLFTLVIIFVKQVNGQNTNQYYFKWEEHKKLTISDFKLNHEDDTTGYKASYYKNGSFVDTILNTSSIDDTSIYYYGYPDTFAHSEIKISPEYYVTGKILSYNIYSMFYPYKSFMIIKMPDILLHEQTHFDISELFARRIRKYLTINITMKNASHLEKKIDSFYQQQILVHQYFDHDAIIDFYQHGDLKISSLKWNKKIANQLDSLKNYENPEGKIILK